VPVIEKGLLMPFERHKRHTKIFEIIIFFFRNKSCFTTVFDPLSVNVIFTLTVSRAFAKDVTT